MFGQFLKEIIEHKYKTFNEFAEKCSISRGHLSDIFVGRTLPKEKTLQVMIEELQPIDPAITHKLQQEWALDKGDGILREEMLNLKAENERIKKVLSKLQNEQKLLDQLQAMQHYKDFYTMFFKDLTAREVKEVLTAMFKELKVLAMDSGKVEELQEKFERLDNLISNIK